MGVIVRENGKVKNTEGLIGCLDMTKGTLEFAMEDSAWRTVDLSDIHIELEVYGNIQKTE